MKGAFRKHGIAGKCLILWIAGVLLMAGFVGCGCKKTPDPELPESGSGSRELVVDIAKEASSTAHTFETIQAMMDDYAGKGLKQICFRPIPDTYAATGSCQGSVVCDPSVMTDQMHRTVHAVFDPNLAFIQAAKRAGMRVTVLYSPYEGGGSVSIPEGSRAQFSFGEVQGIGGMSAFCSSAVAAAKDQLIRSVYAENPSKVSKGKAAKLELVFAAEAFEDRISQNETMTVTPDGTLRPTARLWYSDRNVDYRPADDVAQEVTIGRRMFTDANGRELGEKDCIILTFDLSAYSGKKYFAVTLENGAQFYTLPFSMIRLYDRDGGVLTSTQAAWTRNPNAEALMEAETVPDGYLWGSERMPIRVTDPVAEKTFRAWGFEFQYGGTDWGNGWQNAFVYGVAVGAQNSVGGNLCEGFATVREYWLGQVDRFYARGADTVIITLQNSGGMVSDYRNFGYNYLYVKEFSKQYGVDITKDSFDYLKLMELRGSYFLEFLREVDRVAGERGRTWGMELFAAFESPVEDDNLNGLCHYRMPKIVFDWKTAVDLCDEVVIGDYQWGGYRAEVAAGIRSYAAESGKKVTVRGYAMCSVDGNWLSDALSDSRNSGVMTDSMDACLWGLQS